MPERKNPEPPGAERPATPPVAPDAGAWTGDRTLRAGGETVAVTSLDRVYWPEEGYTKGDLIRYYLEVAGTILPHLADRPLILKRYPSGIRGVSFFQHDVTDAPSYVRTVRLKSETGREIDYVVCDSEATLLYLSNLGAIERHPWHARLGDLERPDRLVFDLDPHARTPFPDILRLALSARELLAELGLHAWPKTSGSRGLHLYVPVEPRHTFEEVADFAERVALRLTEREPRLATLERSLKKRKSGLIYVDHLQNAYGKTVVSPYSVRPKPGATVSTPLVWEEVEAGVEPRDFTIRTVPPRIARRGDLFRDVLEPKQSLDDAMDTVRAW